MNRILLGVLFLFVIPLAALAQPEYPPFEVFGGYSYFRADPEGYNLHGWNASVTGNVTNWFGIEGDFSGHYGHLSDQFGAIPGVNIDQHTFMGGPRLAYRAGSIVPFAHFLIGAARAGTRDEFDDISISDWALASVFGGGVDINLSSSIAIRAAQADWLVTHFDTGGYHDKRQNNFRFSAGIILKFGSH
jgi:hypothetical protein